MGEVGSVTWLFTRGQDGLAVPQDALSWHRSVRALVLASLI
jgi:hypothetical protein